MDQQDQDFTNKLTKKDLKKLTGHFDLETIHSVTLRNVFKNLNLRTIAECVGLERLTIVSCNLENLLFASTLGNLVFLDVTMNKLTNMEGLQALECLETLTAPGNNISSIDDLRYLSNLPKFESLRLQDQICNLSNPICEIPTYRTEVLNLLPKLVTLDGERISGSGCSHSQLENEIASKLENIANRQKAMKGKGRRISDDLGRIELEELADDKSNRRQRQMETELKIFINNNWVELSKKS